MLNLAYSSYISVNELWHVCALGSWSVMKKSKIRIIPHESFEGPTFTEDQSNNPKLSLTFYFVQDGFKVVRKKPQ